MEKRMKIGFIGLGIMGKRWDFGAGTAGNYFSGYEFYCALASKEICEACEKKEVRMIDAPVSGGEPKAIDATLSIMAGGGVTKPCFKKSMISYPYSEAVWYIVGQSEQEIPQSWQTRLSLL